MRRIEININPQILKWAREEAGYDLAEIANKIDIAIDTYNLWEKNGTNIPLGKLKIIANSFKRQLAVFLLPTVPEKLIKPKDYRNLGPKESKLSRKVLEVIRDVAYFRELASEIQGENYWQKRYSWIDEVNVEIEKGSNYYKKLRELLNVSIEDQINWRNDSAAYRNWRLAVENRLGILVFQFSMPMDELHGFCSVDNHPYAIVTNSNHSYTGRIFTIFHELTHILHHESGMCLFEKAINNHNDEWECNAFAGTFLAPRDLIEQTDDLEKIAHYASKLKISREVYLRRLKDENRISDRKFFNLLDQIKKTYKIDGKRKGFVKPEVKSRASRGETFFSMVLDAVHDNRISYSQASNALDLNVSSLLNEI